MTDENHSASASTDSDPAPQTGNIRDRVQKLQKKVSDLSETLDAVDKNLKEAGGKTEAVH